MEFYIASYEYKQTDVSKYAFNFKSLSDLDIVFETIKKDHKQRTKLGFGADINHVDIYHCAININDSTYVDPRDYNILLGKPQTHFRLMFKKRCFKRLYRYAWDSKKDSFHMVDDLKVNIRPFTLIKYP